MRASRQMLSELRRAFWSAWLLGGCVSVLTFFAAALAAALLDAAVPLINFQAFLILIALAAGCVIAIAIISFLRDLILCRAGLWLNHEMGRAVRSSAGQNALRKQDMHRATSALDTLTAFLGHEAAGRSIQAFWVPAYVVLLYFIVPAFAAIAICVAVVLAGTGFWLARGAAGLAAASPQDTASPSIADWEHANCSFVAASYARHKRTGLANALVLTARCGAFLAALGLFSWWSAYDVGALGVFAAGLILLDRSLAPLCAVASAAAFVRDAGGAYRALCRLAASSERKKIADRKAGLAYARRRQPDTEDSIVAAHRLTQTASQVLH